MSRALLAVLAVAAPAGAEEGATRARIALYVAVDEYQADDSIRDLHGCVHDMTRLSSILEKQYGFRTVRFLENAEATRAGIRDAFWQLIDEVRAAHEKGIGDLVVVFGYAGHGGLVKSRNADEKSDTTIVPSDGFKRYKNHIRDDDVNRVLGHLQEELGATVVYIRDSCHSGTAYRRALFAPHRSVVAAGEEPPDAPEENLFDGTDGRPALPNRPNPRLVYLGATGDEYLAEEGVDPDGRPCGKFTWSLARVLAAARPGMTYGELRGKVLQQFRKDWPDSKQVPLDAVSPSIADVVCFGDQVAPLHARILAQDGRTLTLSLGAVHGVTEGAVFRFYRDLTDLQDQVGGIATAKVGAVGDLTCTATLDGELPASRAGLACGRLDAVHFREFRVGTLNELRPTYLRALEGLAMGVAEEGDPYDLALLQREDGAVRAFLPEHLPASGTEDGYLFEASGPDAFAEILARHARVRRLLALERNETALSVSLRPHEGHEAKERPPRDGVRRFAPAAPVDVVVRNPLDHPVFVFAFYEERSLAAAHRSQFALFYPDGPGCPYRVEPGGTFVLKPTDHPYFQWPTEYAGGARFTVKLLFTQQPYDPRGFAHLSERTGVREGMDDLQRYLESVGGGRASHRDAAATRGWWATGSLVFEVEG